jgi:hypothetical protein
MSVLLPPAGAVMILEAMSLVAWLQIIGALITTHSLIKIIETFGEWITIKSGDRNGS